MKINRQNLPGNVGQIDNTYKYKIKHDGTDRTDKYGNKAYDQSLSPMRHRRWRYALLSNLGIDDVAFAGLLASEWLII